MAAPVTYSPVLSAEIIKINFATVLTAAAAQHKRWRNNPLIVNYCTSFLPPLFPASAAYFLQSSSSLLFCRRIGINIAFNQNIININAINIYDTSESRAHNWNCCCVYHCGQAKKSFLYKMIIAHKFHCENCVFWEIFFFDGGCMRACAWWASALVWHKIMSLSHTNRVCLIKTAPFECEIESTGGGVCTWPTQNFLSDISCCAKFLTGTDDAHPKLPPPQRELLAPELFTQTSQSKTDVQLRNPQPDGTYTKHTPQFIYIV